MSDTLFTIEGSVAFLTFNRPEARNAMTWDMYEALAQACETVDARDDVRILILRGAGTAFVAGTDIAQFRAFQRPEDGLEYERRLDRIIDRLEQVRKATIAQVHGVAAGGGCALALACDLCVATPDARFGIPIARTLGNCLSADNYARLLDRVGPARLKDLLFTGRLLDASEAAALGLVHRIVPPEHLESAVLDEAAAIASRAPLTIWATKEAVRRILARRRLETGALDDLIATCYSSDDFRNAVEAFFAKREPAWTGR